MLRRSLVITVFVILVLACAASSALAYGPYVSYPADTWARLVPGTSQAVFMWSEPGAGATSKLMASRVQLSSGTADGPYTVVSDIGGLDQDAWFASGDGLNVTVVWKAGDSVYVKRVELTSGTPVYGPVLASSDAQAVSVRGAGATVTPSGVAADGKGGAYVWCSLSPTASAGDTLLNHVSATTGALAATDPAAQHVSGGTIAALAADPEGHAFALLGAPGRNMVAVQRFAPTLTPDWLLPVSPYLIAPQPGAAPQAIGLSANSTAMIAWSEGTKVKVQRFSATGSRLFPAPPTVTMTGAVKFASDGSSGAYLVGPSADGIVARHILASGREASWDPSALTGLGLTQPHVDAIASNSAGDLFAAYSDVVSNGKPGIALLTYLGSWSDVGPTTSSPEWYSGAVPDGSGGAYVLGGGGGAVLWRIADAGPQVTFRPRAELVQYGKSVTVAGYATSGGGLPMNGAKVLLRKVTGATTIAGGSAWADPSGYYQSTLKPTANATWTATAGGSWSDRVVIKVMPRVTLDDLWHLKPVGTRLTEIFRGTVAPKHAGQRIVIQKAVGSDWRPVASGRLDSLSRFRVTWSLPWRTATYKLRAVLPAHADHAEGASSTATLRVVIRKG